MLKLVFHSERGSICLITVQDNTMLKPNSKKGFAGGCLITVQDNTMLKL